MTEAAPEDGWEALLHPSGVLRFAGKAGRWYTGRGVIDCLRAPLRGVDANLFGVLKAIVDTLGLVIVIASVDTGAHVKGSRHYQNRAVDLGLIGFTGRASDPVTP